MITKENEVVHGVVLKSTPYKESDAILSVYTKEYGKLSILAKGIHKMKSKNASACSSLTLSEFTIIVKKGLCTLIKGSYQNYYRHIKEDIELEAYASYFIEFVYKYCEENDPDTYIYDTLIQFLDALNVGYPPVLLYLLFNSFILKETGSPLYVDSCSYCEDTSHIVGISYSGGGFVCSNHIGEYDQSYDKETLKAFRHINKFTIQNIDAINIPEAMMKELRGIMDNFVEEYTGILFQSKKFLKQFF